MATYTKFALEKLIDLFNNHDHEVGSQLKLQHPEKYKDQKSTDCITYSLNVISHAFKSMGNEKAAKEVWQHGKKGTALANYLVSKHNWQAVYINPDSKHPEDGNQEHAYTNVIANKKCSYYGVPLHYKVTDYRITPKTNPNFKLINGHLGETKLNTLDYNSLTKVDFGFGISKGGMHTWLFSKGNVYEVHWDGIGKDLYEKTSLKSFPWLSGIIVIPSDIVPSIKIASQLKCN